MTREEAIEVLQQDIPCEHDTDLIEALEMAIKALEQEPSGDLISREDVEECKELMTDINGDTVYAVRMSDIRQLPSVKQEPKTGWNNHQIACMLADLFGDTCACNYNGIDEWLSELCDFKDTCCPHPVGVACWEQFLKYSQSRYTECGYEVRDKGALQEPTEGHWIVHPKGIYAHLVCDKCLSNAPYDCRTNYCPNCGARMERSDKK